MAGLLERIAGSMGFVRKDDRRARAREFSKMLRARYDNAMTDDGNRRHWANADGLSAVSAATPAVRRTIRNRARYEMANSPYCNGIVDSYVNYVIGTGPRVQLVTDPVLMEEANAFEDIFESWADEINLGEKLRCMLRSQIVDGEVFAHFYTDESLAHPVKLNLALVECDRVAGTAFDQLTSLHDDGIEYDENGSPVRYHVLRHHPGESFSTEAKQYAATDVIHLYRIDRPGQRRGISRLQPSLNLFAKLRRYINASLGAAEIAAMWAAILYTDAPDVTTANANPFEPIDLEYNTMLTVPAGWKMSQLRAEQPTTTLPDFKAEIVAEAARPLNMPYNIAACNSSNYNYSSGQLDHRTFFGAVDIERGDMVRKAMTRILFAFLDEAVLVEDLVPQVFRSNAFPAVEWLWGGGSSSVDPAKEATAKEIELRLGLTTLAIECGKRRTDWQSNLIQLAREQEARASLGLPPLGTGATSAPTDPAQQSEDGNGE